jgi:hypothetical protein
MQVKRLRITIITQARNANRTLKIYNQTENAGEHLMAEQCDGGRNIL